MCVGTDRYIHDYIVYKIPKATAAPMQQDTLGIHVFVPVGTITPPNWNTMGFKTSTPSIMASSQKHNKASGSDRKRLEDVAGKREKNPTSKLRQTTHPSSPSGVLSSLFLFRKSFLL